MTLAQPRGKAPSRALPQAVTGGYMRLQAVTPGQGKGALARPVTCGYRRLHQPRGKTPSRALPQAVTGGYRWSHAVTGGFKQLPLVTSGYKLLQVVRSGCQRSCRQRDVNAKPPETRYRRLDIGD